MNNTVYIIDDDTDVRTSVAFFLGTAGFNGRPFADPLAFLAMLDMLGPGCVLLDMRMPGASGFDVLEQLAAKRAEWPVVIMTGHGDIPTAVRAMKLGARDFIEKPFEEDLVLEIITRAAATLESKVCDLGRRRAARQRLDSLTERERTVLALLLEGRANKVIAYELDISIRTVEMHRAAMMERLGVRTLAAALRLAFDGGFDVIPTVERLPARRAG